ncbi:MAG: triphosphoribosyl-dephospho-CoA synthase, partial [Rubrivivax sp.]
MLTLERRPLLRSGSPAALPARQHDIDRSRSERIGAQAIRALYDEVALFPKPGLVSRVDAGAHADM